MELGVRDLKKQTGFTFSQEKQTGFTLIEIITAIGVLAILSSVVIAAINPIEQFNKTTDARRKTDLAQIKRALEVYYQDYGRYPEMTPLGPDQHKICSDLACTQIVEWGQDFRPYMDVLPIEESSSKTYAYWTDSTGQSYAIYASLDRGSRDPQACHTDNSPCTNAELNGIDCGGVCDYGVTSPNIAP